MLPTKKIYAKNPKYSTAFAPKIKVFRKKDTIFVCFSNFFFTFAHTSISFVLKIA